MLFQEFLQQVSRLVQARASKACAATSYHRNCQKSEHAWATIQPTAARDYAAGQRPGVCTSLERRRCAPIRGVTVILDISPFIAIPINASHAAAIASAQDAVNQARRCGELLARVKDSLPHGAWLRWLGERCDVSPRQAQRYIRLYENWDKLAAHATRETHLTLNAAMSLLARPKRVKATSEHAQAIESESEKEPRAAAPVTTVKIVTLERFDGTWKGYIVPHTDARYAFVSVVQWSTDGGTIDGTRKAIIRTAADETLRHLFGMAHHNLSSAEVNESESDVRWSFNHFLFESAEDSFEQVMPRRRK